MAAERAGQGPLKSVLRQADLIVIAGVVAIVLMLVIPIPERLLDLLIGVNISIALIILLTAMSVTGALSFSVFPSLLLIVTLFRLALNVSSTRLILSQASAGDVIETFGNFVIAGNLVVGLIVFAILATIQFVVITSGATRVAEVAARFTLDAMPGKQLSIDADLNAGIVNEEQARGRRRDVEREADFYGAMDGASRFVRGDAIASIIIILVNIVGGIAVGVLQRGLDIQQALGTFVSLTVGDGLVTQIPALLISTSTGIIVTRTASESDLGTELLSQTIYNSRLVYVVAVIIAALGLIPGMPILLFGAIAAAMAGFAHALNAGRRREVRVEEQLAAAEVARPTIESPEAVLGLLQIDPMKLEIGYGLIPLVDLDAGGTVLERISAIRRQMALDMGLVVPTIRIRDNLQLNPNAYVVKIRGVEIATGELMTDHYLAMDPGTVDVVVDGISTTEPAFGLPALWITRADRERAEALGYTVVDPPSVLSTHLTELIRLHAAELLGRQDVQRLIDNLRAEQPAVVDAVLPDVLSLADVHRVLQALLEERVSIRDLATVLETLADEGRAIKDVAVLTERVRASLGRTISQQYRSDDGSIHAVFFNPELEQRIAGAVRDTTSGPVVALPPDEIEQILDQITEATQSTVAAGGQPIVMCSQQIRIAVRRMTQRRIPNLVVLAYTELAQGAGVITDAVVDVPS